MAGNASSRSGASGVSPTAIVSKSGVILQFSTATRRVIRGISFGVKGNLTEINRSSSLTRTSFA